MDDLNYKISNEYDGRTRKLYPCVCKFCAKEYWIPAAKLKIAQACSKQCLILLRQKNGKRININCTFCNKEFKRWQHAANKIISKRYFCSRACQKSGSKKYKNKCLGCQKSLIGQARIYCSKQCGAETKYKLNIEKWKNGELTGMDNSEGFSSFVRRYIIKKYDNKCFLCGWNEVNKITNKVPIQVDHIDGNYKNNSEDNLRLLCPNCHSLTSTYGSLNKGKGREKRRLKLREIAHANNMA